jgi:hypothetical protein
LAGWRFSRELRFQQGRRGKVVAAITAAGGKAVAVGGDASKSADAKGIIDAAN